MLKKIIMLYKYIINNSYNTLCENKENRTEIKNGDTQSRKCKVFMLNFDFVKLAMPDIEYFEKRI